MIKNYFKVAIRNLLKRKGYTAINTLGLAIGMAVCVLIILFLKSELNYDRNQEKGNRIYRMVVNRKYPGRSTSYSFIPQSYAAAVKQECPEVEETVRLYNFNDGGSFQLTYGDKKFEEKRVFFVDSNFFRVFSTRILAGDARTALMKPHAVVLTETAAKKYFGRVADAVGKILQPEGNNNPPLLVTAVCSDWPANSHFVFDLLLTTAGDPNFSSENFVNFAAHTYLLLNPNSSPQTVEKRFLPIIEKYAVGNIEKQFAMSYKQFKTGGNGYEYYLQPLHKIHLTSHLEGELLPNGSIQAVYIFGLVAFIILLLACVNFINLATARSAERAKEVGIRKTFGSEKNSLILQFLTESILVSIFSMLVAAVFVFLLLPFFNQLSGKNLRIEELFSVQNILLLLAFTLLIGLAAGIYPAFVLSSFRPIVVLKGNFKSGRYGRVLRNALVVFQFSISVMLIICTIIVNSQMRFMTSEKLGFNKDHTIIIERTDLLGDQTRAFKNELLKMPGVSHVSGGSSLPGIGNFFGVSWQKQGTNISLTGRGIITDDQYAATLGLAIKEGRFFSKDFPTDSLAIVLNERAVMELGLEKPIGTRLTSPDEFYNGQDGSQLVYTVIGVVKDFHYQSLHNPISPLVFTSSTRFKDILFMTAVQVKPTDFSASVKSIESKWKEFVKDRPFQYAFLDKRVEAQYQSEAITRKVFSFFSSLAIFIACIGLLGLAAYATQQRVREISIRKVLGASSGTIVQMLSIDFLKLVFIAAFIAFPIAWYSMYRWLQDFAYRINIGWWVFVVAGLAAVMVAMLTISFQAIKAAVSNPVKSLRME